MFKASDRDRECGREGRDRDGEKENAGAQLLPEVILGIDMGGGLAAEVYHV